MTARQSAALSKDRAGTLLPWIVLLTVFLGVAPLLSSVRFLADPAYDLALHNALQALSIGLAATVAGLAWKLRDGRDNNDFTLTAREESRQPLLEEELRDQRERLHLALQAGKAGTFEWDAGTGLSAWSDELLAMHGFTHAEYTGRHEQWLECVREEDRPIAEQAIRDAMKTGLLDCDFRIRHRLTGEIRWISSRAKVYFNAGGEPARMFGINIDITERKRAEERLRDSEARLALQAERQALLLDIASGMLQARGDKAGLARTVFDKVRPHLDADMCFNYALEAPGGELRLIAGFGFPEERRPELQTLSLGDAFCGLVAATALPLAANSEDLDRDPRAETLKHMGVRCYACHPLYGLDGQVIGTLSMASTRRDDFTPEEIGFIQTLSYLMSLAWERQRAEAEIQRLNRDLEKRVEERTAELAHTNEALIGSNLELQRFAYVAAHDLQTPLRSIAGLTQLLQRKNQDTLNPESEEYIRLVVDNTRRMQVLIEDLLAYSRLEAQARPFEVTDLEKVVEEVCEGLAAPIAETSAEVSHGRLPSLPVDRTQIAQVFANLIENGIKYNRSGSVRVHVSAERRGKDWLFTVHDNGIGIPSEYHWQIFGIFKRLHTYHAYPGSGVGLAICQRIVERHGGRIWVESAEGEGSDFRFTLPMAD